MDIGRWNFNGQFIWEWWQGKRLAELFRDGYADILDVEDRGWAEFVWITFRGNIYDLVF